MRMLHGTEELHSESGYGHKNVLKLNMLDRNMCFCRSYRLGNLMCTHFKVHCFVVKTVGMNQIDSHLIH